MCEEANACRGTLSPSSLLIRTASSISSSFMKGGRRRMASTRPISAFPLTSFFWFSFLYFAFPFSILFSYCPYSFVLFFGARKLFGNPGSACGFCLTIRKSPLSRKCERGLHFYLCSIFSIQFLPKELCHRKRTFPYPHSIFSRRHPKSLPKRPGKVGIIRKTA